MLGIHTVGAHLGVVIDGNGLGGKLGRDNPRGYSDDPIPQNHDDRGDELSHGTGGCNVTITYGGQGHNAPVNAHRNTGKTTFVVFHHIHDGTKDDAQNHDAEHKNQYFGFATGQGFDQLVGLANKMGKF